MSSCCRNGMSAFGSGRRHRRGWLGGSASYSGAYQRHVLRSRDCGAFPPPISGTEQCSGRSLTKLAQELRTPPLVVRRPRQAPHWTYFPPSGYQRRWGWLNRTFTDTFSSPFVPSSH